MAATETIYDVVIVGAGISGTYCAWKIGQKHPTWKILIVDALDRIGGRTYSIKLDGIDDFRADMGAMRFQKKQHVRLWHLIDELHIITTNFTTPTPAVTSFYLRGEVIDQARITRGDVPFKMTTEEKIRSHDTMKLHQYWNDKILANPQPYDYGLVCKDGITPVYEKGVMNAFSEVGSMDAINYLAFRDLHCSQYYTNCNYGQFAISNQANKGHVYKFSANALYSGIHQDEQLFCPVKGFQEISIQMMEKFLAQATSKSAGTREHKKKQLLENLQYRTNGNAVLTFRNIGGDDGSCTAAHVNYVAKKVILAMPADAIKHVHFNDATMCEAINEITPAVTGSPAMKTFLAYDSAWWRNGIPDTGFEGSKIKQIGSDLPCGTILEIGVDKKSGKGVLVCYSEWHKHMTYWKSIDDNSNNGVDKIDKYHLEQINTMLAAVYGVKVSEIPKPTSTVSIVWKDGPIHSAWYFASGGLNYPELAKKAMQPVASRNLHIVGTTFSEWHGWCEGALETSAMVLKEHFSVPDIDNKAK